MESGELQLWVEKNFHSRKIKIWMRRLTPHADENYQYAKAGTIIVTQTENMCAPDKNLKPFLEMDERMFDDFLKLILDYAAHKKIKTETQSFTDGKLQATEKHLENTIQIIDKLLFNNQPK